MRVGVLLLSSLSMTAVQAQEQAYVDMVTQGNENVAYAYADVLRADPIYEVLRLDPKAPGCASTLPGEPEVQGVIQHQGDAMLADEAERIDEVASEETIAASRCVATDGLSDERRISGYNVEYRYKGQLYMSYMEYDPGNKLRIRITVAPAD